jgi:hypothetical protein
MSCLSHNLLHTPADKLSPAARTGQAQSLGQDLWRVTGCCFCRTLVLPLRVVAFHVRDAWQAFPFWHEEKVVALSAAQEEVGVLLWPALSER